MFLTVKKIGTSVALALLDSSLAQIKEKYGALLLKDIRGPDDKTNFLLQFSDIFMKFLANFI